MRALDSGKTYEESYDKLILAPGARPVVPNLPGVELERVFTLRTVEDTLRIRQFVDSQSPQSATVIAGVLSAWKWRRTSGRAASM